MKRLVKAISEKTFESWDKQRQDQWLKDHPNSKFKDLDEIKNLRKEIDEKESFRPSDYADNWGQGNRERESEDRELDQLNEKLKRLERKPLHKVRLKKSKPVSPFDKYKLPQDKEPQFSEQLEPFVNFSKKTGIRNIDDLKKVANDLSGSIRNYESYQAKQEYKKLADSLLNKYKGKTIKTSTLDPEEKKLVQMLAIYKREKEFYADNEKRKENPEYKQWQEMRDKWERANENLKPLMRSWYNAKGAEERETNPERKQELTRKRAQLGKELHNERLKVDNLIKQADDFEKKYRKDKFPDLFPIEEPIFGKQTIESEKLGLNKDFKV